MCPDCRENSQLIEQFARCVLHALEGIGSQAERRERFAAVISFATTAGSYWATESSILALNVCQRIADALQKLTDPSLRSTGRTFADSEGDDPSRVGGPNDPLLSGSAQLSSVISFRDNHSGVSRGLQKASASVSKNTGETTLIEAFQEIQHQCEQISLPKVVSDSAKQLFKRQEEERILKSKKRPAIIAACIFIACRDQRVERTFKEIVALSGVSKSDIAACFSVMQRTFGVAAANVQQSSAAGIVNRFCNHLGLPPAIQSATIEVARNVDELGVLAGRSPLSVASACLYFTSHAFGMGKSVKEIGAVAGISDSTLRTSYKYVLWRTASATDVADSLPQTTIDKERSATIAEVVLRAWRKQRSCRS
jgi:transcription initiation factor TFIIB